MTDLRTKLDALVFGAQGAVTPKMVDAARALVVAEGSTPEAVETFRDSFDAFRTKGYFDGATRTALDKAYVALVAALPDAPAVSGGSVASLAARLTEVQALVTTRKAEVGALEAQVAAQEAQITAKSAQATALITQKQAYQTTLKAKEKQRETILVFALFGAFGAASTAVGIGSAMSIGDLRTTIADLDKEIAATQAQRSSLESTLTTYQAEQRTRRRELAALQTAEVGLTAATQDGEDVSALPVEQQVVALRGRVDDTHPLAENLRAQIAVLHDLSDAASGTDAQLSALITTLSADLESLEKRIATSEKALLGVIIDLVFKASGTPANLQLGPLSISKKALLLDGLPGLRLELDKQLDKLVNKMITDGLVEAGTAPQVASLIVKLLRGQSTAKVEASPTLKALSAEDLAELSEPQRLVIDAVVREAPAGEAREGLIAKVAAMPALTDIQARAAASLALIDAGPAGGQAAAIDAVLGKSSLTRREAARTVLDFGLTTTYGDAPTGEPLQDALTRMVRLARRALSFFPSDAPAARALADGLVALDASNQTPTEDHALLRAHLLAARALAPQTEASADRVALEVLRGWREATSHRSGEGAEARQHLDAGRALAALGRLLPAGDSVLTPALPADTAGALARLGEIEAALAARA